MKTKAQKEKVPFKEKFNNWLSVYGYATILTLIVFIVDILVYFVIPLIGKNFKIHNFSIKGFDDKIPLIKVFFIPYFLSYPFWAIAPIIAGKNRKRFCDWFIAVIISFAVVGIIYLFAPTTISRPIDEMLASDKWIDQFIGNFYMMNGGYLPFGCFPSIHCLLSAFCYISIRNQKNIHIVNRIGILTMDILILLSTLFTRQHYIVDLIGSVVLAELTFFISHKFNLGRKLELFINRVEDKIKQKHKKPQTVEQQEQEEELVEVK